jgi:selenocysteine lyase/cysteine desulfurase
MEPLLYLDTARLGLMRPKVSEALHSLTQFASIEGLSCRFDAFLYGGFEAWPPTYQARFSGLSDWQGIAEFKNSLRDLVGIPHDTPVFLASRSTSLMKIAARILFQRCRKVLVTDLEWPGHLEILRQEKDRVGWEIVEVPIRSSVLKGEISADDFCRVISAEYRKHQADGLFLSVVSFQGIRLPVTRITRDLQESRRPPKFTVLDGAQAIGHVTLDFGLEHCDLLLAGCHKWLRSHHPLGFAISFRRRSRKLIRLAMESMAKSWEADDPLLTFSMQIESDDEHRFSETLNLTGLFSGRAALAENYAQFAANQFGVLMENRHALEQAAEGTTWQPLLPHPSLRSGIMLFQAKDSKTKKLPPAEVREKFLAHGVALSSYDHGLVRVSLPQTKLSPAELDRFSASLAE